MNSRNKKYISDLINKEVDERDYNYERLQDAWFQKSCIENINRLK